MNYRDNGLIDVFCKISDPDTMERFFEEIFTDSERRDLSLRWELMRRLRQRVPQRQIAADLGISLCKITRGAKILKDRTSVSSSMLK